MSSSISTKVGLAAAGLVAGVVLAGTLGASAASPSPSPSTASGSATTQRPGDNGADGVPEAQEHHGWAMRHRLGRTGTITEVGSASVTIKDAAGHATTYAVTSASDIDKDGEAALKDLKPGDAVRFITDSSGKAIDKLHAGDEAKDRPMGGPLGGPAGPPPGAPAGPPPAGSTAPSSGTSTGGSSTGSGAGA